MMDNIESVTRRYRNLRNIKNISHYKLDCKSLNESEDKGVNK